MSTKARVEEVEAQSYLDTDLILDTPILLEEVEDALNHLKKSSSGGADMLSPQHLLHSGPLFKKWICQVFNTILALEAIPSSFKDGIIIPVYKGKGKDPLSQQSYRGITLTSVLAKSCPVKQDSSLLGGQRHSTTLTNCLSEGSLL